MADTSAKNLGKVEKLLLGLQLVLGSLKILML
jgi:hypothetical protein